MTFTVLLKRSNVASHIPNTTQLALGELSVNTYDGKLYFVQQQNTTNTVLTISPLPPSITLTGGVSGSANFSGSNAITISTNVLTATTQAPSDSSANVATTAFVQNTVVSYLSLAGGTTNGDIYIVNSSGQSRFHVDSVSNSVATDRVSFVVIPGQAVQDFFSQNAATQIFSNTNSNSLEWVISWNYGATIGNNLGADITFTPISDAQMTMPTAMTIRRSNGLVAFGGTITTVTQPSSDNTTNAATTAFVRGQFPTNNNVGTFTSVTVNSKGLVTNAANMTFTGAVIGTASNTTVNLSLANTIAVSNVIASNHYVANGTAPSISAGTLCYGVAVGSNSNDVRGQIGFLAGSNAAGNLGTVTFSTPYTSQPWVVACNSGGNLAGIPSNTAYIPNIVVQNVSTTGFSIWTATGGLTIGTAYYVNYMVIG